MPPKVKKIKTQPKVKAPPIKVIPPPQNMSESVKKAYDNLSETSKKKYHAVMAFLTSDRAKSLGKTAIIGILSLILIGGFAKYGSDAVEQMQVLIDRNMWNTLDRIMAQINAQMPYGITVSKAYQDLQNLIITMLSYLGGSREGTQAPYFNFTGRGIQKVKIPKKIKAQPKVKAPKKKDGLYYQITESPMAKEFYDTITDKEFINYSADFLKALVSIWLFGAVYKATTPSRPAVETQTDATIQPNRGIVVEGRRGIVVEGRRDDDFGVAPIDVEDVIRSSGANMSNLSESEQGRLQDFIAVTPLGESSCLGCLGMGLMGDISEKFKISPETKKIGKDAFKALLLASLAGAVGAYSVKTAENDRNLNYDAERTDPIYIPPKKASYDYSERAKNWTSEVRNKNMMNDILDEFSDISEDVSSLSSNFSDSSGSYGLGLKKTKKGDKNIKKIEIPEVLKTPIISKINNKIKEAIQYVYNKSPSKDVIMLFISVIFALGSALIFTNSQTLTDSALNNIMNFTRILEDCANGRVSSNGIKSYVSHYIEQFVGYGINSYRDVFGGKLKKSMGKSSKKAHAPDIVLPESFYQKRIKPITKHVYDIITSDETITVAKSLAQIAFLTLIMYGIKELGTTAYSFMALENQDPRTSRQVLEELAEQEIARPTYYTEASGRYRGQVTEYDKSDYPREWPKDVGSDNPYSDEYNPTISKINRILGEADSDIYSSKAKTDKLIEMLKKEDPIHIKNLMLKHPVLRDIKAKKPHKFTTEFPEQLPTLEEKIKWKKGQMLSGKGLKEDATKLSKETIAKLKKVAKKIYDKIRSEEGQTAVKGLTVATILAGLTALMRSRMGVGTPQLSPQELKERYMESIGESVLF